MKINMKILAITGLLFCSALRAQEKKPLTLQEAVDLGLKNSKQLKASQARIEQATAALREAIERKLPDVKLSGSYIRLNSANFSLKSNNNNNSGSGSSGEAPKINQAAYGIVNASLPIYAGGKIRYGIESSRYLEQAARLDEEHDEGQVIINTTEAYVNLYKARTAVGLVQENLAESQQRVKDFTNLEKNGLLARNDLLKAELQSSNTELSLLDAQNNWQLANINMDLMLGLPEQTELILDSNMLSQATPLSTLEEYVQDAIKNRKDMAALDLRKKAAETGVKSTKADLYPSLALTGGYIAADIPNFFSVTNAVNVGVGVSYNIGSLWKTKAKVQQAEGRAKELDANEALLNDQMRLDVNKNYLAFLSSQKKIEVYQKAMEQANENYRITKNKYNNSLATTTDLLDADVAQLQARLSYTLARADAVVAYKHLLLAAGILGKQ